MDGPLFLSAVELFILIGVMISGANNSNELGVSINCEAKYLAANVGARQAVFPMVDQWLKRFFGKRMRKGAGNVVAAHLVADHGDESARAAHVMAREIKPRVRRAKSPRNGASAEFEAFAVGMAHGAHLTGADVGEAQLGDDRLEEADFFVDRLDEAPLLFGVEDGQGDAGHAAASADVDDRVEFARRARRAQRVDEMALDGLARVGDGRQVDLAVPGKEQVEVAQKLVDLGAAQLDAQ